MPPQRPLRCRWDRKRTRSGLRPNQFGPPNLGFVAGIRAQFRARIPGTKSCPESGAQYVFTDEWPDSGHDFVPGIRARNRARIPATRAQFGGPGIICGQPSLWPRALNLEGPWPEGWPWHGSLLPSAGRARPLPRAPALSRLFRNLSARASPQTPKLAATSNSLIELVSMRLTRDREAKRRT